MTRRILRILAALAALGVVPAFSADVNAQAVKVPTVPCTTAICSGWYVGGQIEGAGPIGTGQADLTNGAGIGLHAGYQLWNGNFFAAAEVGATGYFGASTFTPAPGLTVSPGHYSVDYDAKLGYGFQGLLSTGSTTTPSQGLFANLNANLLSPYVVVGGRTRDFSGLGAVTGFTTGAGIEYAIGNGWNIGVEYLHVNYNQTVNGVSVGTENVFRIPINRMF